jgi:hypothetical protein
MISRALTRCMNVSAALWSWWTRRFLYQCIVHILWVMIIFWSGYVSYSILYKGNGLQLTVSGCYSWEMALNFGLNCQMVAGLLMWDTLSDEKTGLSFTIAAGARQRSHSRVRVSWDSRPCFTVSDSRLSFSSPRTTLRVTVEVFEPASTRDYFPTGHWPVLCNSRMHCLL